MRISDWSSDVCSSDLGQAVGAEQQARGLEETVALRLLHQRIDRRTRRQRRRQRRGVRVVVVRVRRQWFGVHRYTRCSADRKSVVSGKSGSVRVYLGGRRIINKHKQQNIHKKNT